MATLPKEYAEGWAEGNAIFRTARKQYRCAGNGGARPHSDGCTSLIRPGDSYIEYVGETPAYQRGSTVCLPCALAFGYIVPAAVVETGGR
jgi:hypothetical protein